MPTLRIGDQSVQVDEGFLKLSPEQQNATVEEIAQSLATTPQKAQIAKQEPTEAADHGLSERQKLSPVGKALSPITSYPETYQHMNQEARDQILRGVDQLSTGFGNAKEASLDGLWDATKGAGNVALGTLGYVSSPISAAYRSVVGQPVEDVTGIPREYTEFAAQLATPGIGLTRLPGKPGAPVNPVELQPRSVTPEQAPAMGTGPSGADAALAMQRLREQGINVDVPRAITTDSVSLQRTGQGLSHTPIIGDPLAKAVHETVPAQIRGARDVLADQYGAGNEANVAGRAGNVLSEAATAETRAATNAARASDDAVLAAHQRAHDETLRGIGQAETQSLERARAAVGDMSPQDMGQTLIARLRTGEQAAEANKTRLYQQAGEGNATVSAEAVGGAHNHVNQALHNEGFIVDPPVNGHSLTPASARMMDELGRFSRLEIGNKVTGSTAAEAGAPAQKVGVNVQGIEQTRKRLSAMRQAAQNPTDQRSAGRIMRAFDEWEANSVERALISGDPEALQAYKQARGANTEWRQRFFNDENEAGKFVTKIVTGEVTPQEVANYIVGASQVGAKGSSSRLLTRIAEATGNDQEALQAIRGGVWNRLSQATEGATAKAPEKVASSINEFLNGSGRDVANRLFTPEQQGVMRAYADTLRRGQTARELTAEVAKNTKPSLMTVEKGPIQQLADRVIGGKLGRDEALWRTIEGYAKKGGDVKALAGLMRELPQQMKGDIAGSIVRGLGESARTGQFSLDAFASDWGKITPQAKAVMFGNAGAHVKALDDIATIAQRLKDVKGKYGNSSGTGQTTAFQKLAAVVTGVVGGAVAPMTALTAAGGAGAGYVGARVLASPAGAASLAKYAKALERSVGSPSPASQAMVTMTERNLVNTIKTLSVTPRIYVDQSPRLLQGPVPARAQDEQR